MGVLDCVANTIFLAVNKLLRLLCNARLRSGSPAGPSKEQQLALLPLSDDQEVLKRRRERAISAYNFVRGKSTLAAKPLEFGLRQIRSCGSCPGG